MQSYIFNSFSRENSLEIKNAITSLYKTQMPVIVCVGTDLVTGDSFGPLVGTLIKNKLQGKSFIYGTLDSPITAKEVGVLYNNLKKLHPLSKVLVIDAAVGVEEDVGTVKIKGEGVKPGLGYNKDLPLIGDVSIIGIVSSASNSLSVRLGLVYRLALDVSNGVIKALF